jgi:hypothetical protein
MALHTALQQPELLTSWKEIACYLGKGVRTVQRWEQQFGLPVRRPNERAKGIVHATRQDLDHWLAAQWSQRNREVVSNSPPNQTQFDAVRASLQQAAALREANRHLLSDVKRSLVVFFEECEALARKMTAASRPH